VITSFPEYHGRHVVSTGSFKAFTEYLDDVMGTRPSVSPLYCRATMLHKSHYSTVLDVTKQFV